MASDGDSQPPGPQPEASPEEGRPPPEAELQDDGSFVQVLANGSTCRWTQRPDGSWRKPERKKKASPSLKHAKPPPELESGLDNAKLPLEPLLENGKPPLEPTEEDGKLPFEPSLEDGRPPPEAEEQEDGSYVLVLASGTSCRWTKRPDGTWRKPEKKKKGWVGELEATAYVPLPISRSSEREKKHELHRPWRIWLRELPAKDAKPWNNSTGGGKWADDQQLVHEFHTVEDYWCMAQFSRHPSYFENGRWDYSIFESGVTPAWEDPRFKRGGRWIMKLDKVKPRQLDVLWACLSMALIGEAFSDTCGDVVRGATMSLRSRSSKVALWLERAQDREMVKAIGREYLRALTDDPELKHLAATPLTFEDFGKDEVPVHLKAPKKDFGKDEVPVQQHVGSTIGIFQ